MKTMVEKLFLEYEPMAHIYASRVFGYQQLGYEYDDLVQEFRLKIFTSIEAYGRRYIRYMNGEAVKPVHIKYYLQCACSNKLRDFMKYISRENYKVRLDDADCDYGIEQDTDINPTNNTFIVHGVDLLEGLVGIERIIFSLWLRGYGVKLLNKVYNTNSDTHNRAMDVVERQRSYLIQKYGSELRQSPKVYFRQVSNSED